MLFIYIVCVSIYIIESLFKPDLIIFEKKKKFSKTQETNKKQKLLIS